MIQSDYHVIQCVPPSKLLLLVLYVSVFHNSFTKCMRSLMGYLRATSCGMIRHGSRNSILFVFASFKEVSTWNHQNLTETVASNLNKALVVSVNLSKTQISLQKISNHSLCKDRLSNFGKLRFLWLIATSVLVISEEHIFRFFLNWLLYLRSAPRCNNFVFALST